MPAKVDEGFDLIGNTVAVKVVSAIAERLAEVCQTSQDIAILDDQKLAFA